MKPETETAWGFVGLNKNSTKKDPINIYFRSFFPYNQINLPKVSAKCLNIMSRGASQKFRIRLFFREKKSGKHRVTSVRFSSIVMMMMLFAFFSSADQEGARER